MARFSRRTVAAAARAIDTRHGSFTKLLTFLEECGAPGEILERYPHTYPSGRLEYLRKVLTDLNDEAPEHLQAVLSSLIEQGAPGDVPSALEEDGFDVHDNGTLHLREVLPKETEQTRDRLHQLLKTCRRHASADVLQHHLDEHERLYRSGAYGPATGEGRKFVEQLLLDVANWEANRAGVAPKLDRPAAVRAFWEGQGFFDAEEKRKLVDGIYGFLSETGSHPGLTDASVARMAHAIVLNFGLYVLEKWCQLLPTNT
jgi:hypothetical protein